MRPSVLHLIDTGGPGGAETVYHDIISGLARRGWGCVATVPVRDWLHNALRDSGIEPVLVSTQGSFDLGYLRRLTGLARSGPVLIHAHLLTSSVYGALAGTLARLPLICTFHGTVDIALTDRFREAKFRIISGLAKARVVFVSESLRHAFLDSVPLARARTAVIHNGIDVSRFRPRTDTALRRELGARDGEIIVGAIGNVRPSKGYDILLRTAALLRHSATSYRFIIVGQPSGELYEELRALHATLGLDERVRFLGFRQDIPELMAGLDMYVSSSTAEGFSLTTVEAMASGVPVVATRCGGPEEIVDEGVTGVLVPSHSPAALADAIERLAGDASLRSRLSAAARESVAQRFTVDAMVDRYERLYESCLTKRAPVTRRHAVLPEAHGSHSASGSV